MRRHRATPGIFSLTILATLFQGAAALAEPLPPMGMHTWYVHRLDYPISETLVLEQFDHMATNGWQEYGYDLVVIDDGWQGSRDTNGVLQANPVHFPHGIKWLADLAHSKGFKLGIYTEPTATTAAGGAGSEGHLAQDARTFAGWGIDFIKFDMGLIPYDQLTWRPETDTAEFASALETVNWSGHLHVGLGLAPYGAWVHHYASSWRASHGVPPYTYAAPGLGVDVTGPTPRHVKYRILVNWDRMMEQAAAYGPGKWASLDSLPTWFAPQNPDAFRFCASLFSMSGVDLFCHNFPRIWEPAYPICQPLLTGEYMRINQDPLCSPPVRVQASNITGIYGELQGWEVWKRRLGAQGDVWHALLAINREETNTATIPLDWTQLGFTPGEPVHFVNLDTGTVETVTEKVVSVAPFSTTFLKYAPAGAVNPKAPFILRSRMRQPDFLLEAASLPGCTSTLSTTTDLVAPDSWITTATNTADAGGTVRFTYPVQGDHRPRWFRVETQ